MIPKVSDYYNKGTKALLKGDYEKALSWFKKETGECKELYLNKGNALRKLGQFQEAGKSYVRACASDVFDFNGVGGLYAPALCNLGLLYYGNGQDSEAITCYKRALEIDPLCYDAIWNCSTALLRDYCSGGVLNKDAWKMYLYRFKSVKPIDTSIPLWDFKSNGRVLILAEQGLGDKLMWGRFIASVSKIADVTVQLPKILHGLFPWKCVEAYNTTDYDFCVPIASLASEYGFGDGVWIPGYKRSKKARTYKIVVEWAGSATHANNTYRSCYSQYFSDLAKKFPDIEFINVRPDSVKIAGVKKIAGSNFVSTKETLLGTDLVISVDTSIVHLSGSMGIETWMLQPLRETDFRWGKADLKLAYGKDIEWNPWYSSVAVIDNYGWDKTFKELELRLEKWVAERRLEECSEMLAAMRQ